MTTKKHPIRKPKAVICGYSALLSIRGAGLVRRYAEVLRLRQVVRQAESQARRAKVGFYLH